MKCDIGRKGFWSPGGFWSICRYWFRQEKRIVSGPSPEVRRSFRPFILAQQRRTCSYTISEVVNSMAASLATYSSIKGGSGRLLRRKPRVRSKVRSKTFSSHVHGYPLTLSEEPCLTDETASEGKFARRALLKRYVARSQNR